MYSYFSHPNKVCMNYFNHLMVSLSYSRIFLFASFKAFIHAIFPNLFITSTTKTISDINNLLKINNCKNE